MKCFICFCDTFDTNDSDSSVSVSGDKCLSALFRSLAKEKVIRGTGILWGEGDGACPECSLAVKEVEELNKQLILVEEKIRSVIVNAVSRRGGTNCSTLAFTSGALIERRLKNKHQQGSLRGIGSQNGVTSTIVKEGGDVTLSLSLSSSLGQGQGQGDSQGQASFIVKSSEPLEVKDDGVGGPLTFIIPEEYQDSSNGNVKFMDFTPQPSSENNTDGEDVITIQTFEILPDPLVQGQYQIIGEVIRSSQSQSHSQQEVGYQDQNQNVGTKEDVMDLGAGAYQRPQDNDNPNPQNVEGADASASSKEEEAIPPTSAASDYDNEDLGESLHSKGKWTCPDCHKEFKNSQHVQRHIRIIHGKEKPFKCEMCDQSFALNHNLQRHMRTHTGEKTSQCTECGKLFSEGHNLKRHLITAHNFPAPFTCPICKRKFAEAYVYKKHLKRAHDIND